MEPSQALPTKDKILHIAIDLFARQGYKDISVREIAKAAGIRASSLYKHYQSKEDILESIFALFRKMIGQTFFSQEELEMRIHAATPEQYLNEAFQLFKQVMWAEETIRIAKIITLEQRRNQSVRQFFMQELIEKPNSLMQYVFERMMQAGTIRPNDACVLAEEYNAYIICLYFEQNFLNDSICLDEIEMRMQRHNRFFARYVLNGVEETMQ